MLLKGGLNAGHIFFGEMPPEMKEETAAFFAGDKKGYLFEIALAVF